MKYALSSLSVGIAVAFTFATSPQGRAANPPGTPAWEFQVPQPASPAEGSSIQSITMDGAGNAFLVLNVTRTVNNIPDVPYGTQMFLLNSKGVSLGVARYPGFARVVPLSVSARKVIAVADGSVVQFTPDGGGVLHVDNIAVATNSEVAVEPTPLNYSYKYLHSTYSPGGFVTLVRRYLASKLSKVP